MRSYIMTIDPEKATELLRSNTENRSLSQKYVERLARVMAAGRWELSPQGIVLDPDGKLLDGQHRLAAIVRSGCTQEFWVTDGVPHQAFRYLDGGQARSMSDVLKIEGFADYVQLATISRRICAWNTGQPWTRPVPTREEIHDVIDKDPLVAKAAHFAHNWRGRPVPAVAGFVWWLFSSIDPDAAVWFMEGLRTGAGLEPGSGILAARERLLRETGPSKRRGVFISPEMQIAWLIIGWNAYRDGRSLTKIQTPDPMTNERYPRPH